MVEKQDIINLSSKSYTFVILSDAKVAFLREGKDVAFMISF